MENITSWRTDINLPDIDLSFVGKKYKLSKRNNITIWEKYIYDIVLFHLREKNISCDCNKYTIEFSFQTDISKFSIELDKTTKKYPLISIISFLNNDSEAILFTDIDLDQYKYKEIEDNKKLFISFAKMNNHICFDGSKYYGSLREENEQTSLYLKINVWDKLFIIDEFVSNDLSDNFNSDDMLYIPIKNENMTTEKTYENKLLESLFYEKKRKMVLNKTVKNNKEKDYIIIENKNTKYIDIITVKERYGEIAEDIFPFLNENIELLETNIFYNNKIILNALPKEVCYWLINESELSNKWIESPYHNYDEYLNVENLPAISSFLLFISHFWLDNIRDMYKIKNLDFIIKELFIAKNKKNMNKPKKNTNDEFLVLTIQLNDTKDFINGEIEFDEQTKYIIQQGDMLIHAGKRPRTEGYIEDGEKIMLILYIDIKNDNYLIF
jgi:uncharacterized protein YueI